jgi:hypothetical protein
MFGWKDDTLQRALNSRCGNAVCSELKTQTSEEAMKCTLPQNVPEQVDGCTLNTLNHALKSTLLTVGIGLSQIPGNVMVH